MYNIIKEDIIENIDNIYSKNKNIKDTYKELINFNEFISFMNNIKDKKIVINCDLDFDGFSCAYILHDCFKELEYDFDIHISTRKNGYGLNKHTIDKFRKLGYNVLVTADFGIQQINEVKYAYDIGYENVAVIDHHTIIQDKIPNCDCVMNPKFHDKSYELYTLSAGGVCYKLMKDYYKYIGKEFDANNDLLRMCAMSNIADMVELRDGVWDLVKQGLEILDSTKDKRLKKLIHKSLQYKDKLSELDVSFSIAPVVGSVSRLSEPEKITVPFIKGDIKKYDEMAELNLKRREIQAEALNGAIDYLSNIELGGIIFYIAENIPDGVCGLVASGISKHFSRPAIVMNNRGNYYGGSGRSVGTFNLLEALNQDDFWRSAAGHAMALGVSIDKDKFEMIGKSEKINKYIEEHKHELIVDETFFHVEFEDIPNLHDYISMYAPFGQGNARPKFYTENIEIENYYYNSKANMTLLKLTQVGDKWGVWVDDVVNIQGISFLSHDGICLGDTVDLWYYLEEKHKIMLEQIRKVEFYDEEIY